MQNSNLRDPPNSRRRTKPEPSPFRAPRNTHWQQTSLTMARCARNLRTPRPPARALGACFSAVRTRQPSSHARLSTGTTATEAGYETAPFFLEQKLPPGRGATPQCSERRYDQSYRTDNATGACVALDALVVFSFSHGSSSFEVSFFYFTVPIFFDCSTALTNDAQKARARRRAGHQTPQKGRTHPINDLRGGDGGVARRRPRAGARASQAACPVTLLSANHALTRQHQALFGSRRAVPGPRRHTMVIRTSTRENVQKHLRRKGLRRAHHAHFARFGPHFARQNDKTARQTGDRPRNAPETSGAPYNDHEESNRPARRRHRRRPRVAVFSDMITFGQNLFFDLF